MAEPNPEGQRAPPRDALGLVLLRLAQALALVGAAVLGGLTLMSLASIAGRALLSRPLPGDYELVQLGCAVAVASFLPYCQMRRGHVIVDFFTARAAPRLRAALDALGALALAACAGLVAWRMVLGASGIAEAGETTTILGIPIWWPMALMVPGFALLCATGLYTAWNDLRGGADVRGERG